MSEEDSFSKLTRLSSGSLRPKKRRPLKNSGGDDQLTQEETTKFLMKESILNDSVDSLRANQSREDKSLDKLNSDDDEFISDSEHDSIDNNQENDTNESDEYDLEEFEAQYGHTRKQENTKTSVDNRDTRDISTSTSVTNKSELKSNSNIFDNRTWVWVFGVILLCLWLAKISFSSESEEIIDIEKIKNNFSTQDDDLWTAFESGIRDVVNFSRPSTFILLYKPEAENTLEELLQQLTQYAACIITDCSKEPITVTDTELNSPEMIKDYGKIIDKYKNQLEDKGVMIIKNIENVKGIPAQAFHSFCDEYSPLVEKSLLIFTMKINKLNNPNKVDFVDQYFRNKWTDIKVDTFNALITRMSSMVLEVKS